MFVGIKFVKAFTLVVEPFNFGRGVHLFLSLRNRGEMGLGTTGKVGGICGEIG